MVAVEQAAWRSKDTPTLHYHLTCVARSCPDTRDLAAVTIAPGSQVCVACREPIGTVWTREPIGTVWTREKAADLRKLGCSDMFLTVAALNLGHTFPLDGNDGVVYIVRCVERKGRKVWESRQQVLR